MNYFRPALTHQQRKLLIIHVNQPMHLTANVTSHTPVVILLILIYFLVDWWHLRTTYHSSMQLSWINGHAIRTETLTRLKTKYKHN
jgi:hypothetical protein